MAKTQNLILGWQQRSSSSKEQIAQALKNIKIKKHKKTNQYADEIHEKVFKNIDCLDCANCCKTTPALVNRTDSIRIANFLNLKQTDFETQFLIIDEDGDQVFKMSPCVFLNDNNTCRIYEVRPRACREYPHTDHLQFTSNFKIHKPNAEICPAVYHIIELLGKKISTE